MSDIFTSKEVAARLKMPPKTVLEYLRRGTLPGFRIGKHWRVRKVDLEAFFEVRAKPQLHVVPPDPLDAIAQAIAAASDGLNLLEAASWLQEDELERAWRLLDFTMATTWGKAKENPVERVRLFREDNGRTRWLPDDEGARLLAASPPYLKPLVITAIHTGMRQSELLSLTWENMIKGVEHEEGGKGVR